MGGAETHAVAPVLATTRRAPRAGGQPLDNRRSHSGYVWTTLAPRGLHREEHGRRPRGGDVTNYHAFQLREKVAAGKITKSILTDGQPSPFTETPDQMVRRVYRELKMKKNIIVPNDEAHHCYRRKPDAEDETLTGDPNRRRQTTAPTSTSRQWAGTRGWHEYACVVDVAGRRWMFYNDNGYGPTRIGCAVMAG